jgi:threonine/homoserine/homoserine lactone efflux protein
MGRAIGEILPFAVGIAISPVPIIAVILVLFSPRARSNGPAFVLGWALGLSLVSAVVYILADAGDVATDQSASDSSYSIKLALGVLLLVLAFRNWRKQSRAADGGARTPKWMGAIDSFTPVKTTALAVALTALNPKNLTLSIAAAASIAQAGASTAQAVVALVVFVVLASVTIAAPVAVYLTGGDRAASTLDGWKAWLSDHSAAVMGGLFLVFGALLIGQALVGLSG